MTTNENEEKQKIISSFINNDEINIDIKELTEQRDKYDIQSNELILTNNKSHEKEERDNREATIQADELTIDIDKIKNQPSYHKGLSKRVKEIENNLTGENLKLYELISKNDEKAQLNEIKKLEKKAIWETRRKTAGFVILMTIIGSGLSAGFLALAPVAGKAFFGKSEWSEKESQFPSYLQGEGNSAMYALTGSVIGGLITGCQTGFISRMAGKCRSMEAFKHMFAGNDFADNEIDFSGFLLKKVLTV